MTRLEIGQYLISDPRLCGGHLVFRQTRIKVRDALEMVEAGLTPEQVAQNYPGLVSPEAVREALILVGGGAVREVEAAA